MTTTRAPTPVTTWERVTDAAANRSQRDGSAPRASSPIRATRVEATSSTTSAPTTSRRRYAVPRGRMPATPRRTTRPSSGVSRPPVHGMGEQGAARNRSVTSGSGQGVRLELAREVGVGPAGHDRALAGVLHRVDLAVLVQAVDQVAAVVGQQRPELHARPRQLALDLGQRVRDALARLRADDHRVRLALAQPRQDHGVRGVGLVDHDQLRHLVGADLREHLAHRGQLALGVGVRAIHDVQDQVGVGDLLQRAAERLHQLVRQVPDEADRVAHGVDAAVGGGRTPRGGVQGGEERVLHQHPGVGEPVEQARLAGVGVARDGHARDVVATALLALGVAGALHLAQVAPQLGDLGVDPAPVGLDLGLTGTTATDAAAGHADAATGLAGEVAAPAAQALLHVAQLRQLDLRLPLAGLRVLGEDVEDQRGAVDDLDLEAVLEVPQLARRQLAVGDDGVGAGGLDDLPQAIDLAAADEGGRIGPLTALVDRVEDLRAGGLGEQRELRHGVLGVLDRALGPHAHEHDALEAQLAVLDLGDVLEVSAKTRHPAELVPLGEVQLTGGELGVVVVGVPGDEAVPVGALDVIVLVSVLVVVQVVVQVGVE